MADANQICGCDAANTHIGSRRTLDDVTIDQMVTYTTAKINNTVGVSAGIRTMLITSKNITNKECANGVNDNGKEPIKKHDSYQRRLARLKQKAIKSQYSNC